MVNSLPCIGCHAIDVRFSVFRAFKNVLKATCRKVFTIYLEILFKLCPQMVC